MHHLYYVNWLGVDRQTVGQWCGENIRWKTSTRNDCGEIDVQRVAGRCTGRYRIPRANLIAPVCSTWTLKATSKEKITYEKQNMALTLYTTLVKPRSRQCIDGSKIFQTGGVGANSTWGGVTYNLAIFPRKQHKNENNSPDKKVCPCGPLDPPLHWAW